MKNQYQKVVYLDEKGRTFEFKAPKGMRLEVVEESHDKLFIQVIDMTKLNYANPPIPEGWEYVSGEWNKGLVIERESDSSQFVWIPVASLPQNGMLHGGMYDSSFGRRNYSMNEHFTDEFQEEFEGKLALQTESIQKYGGFYISRYEVSMQGNHICSVKGEMPLSCVNFYEAMSLANGFENKKDVKSHLTFGAEYDSVLLWLIHSGAKTPIEVVKNSSGWGNFLNSDGSTKKAKETGSSEKYCTNAIYDLAGNLDEWTQEKYQEHLRVTRSGHFELDGHYYPVCYRNYRNPARGYKYTGFRVVLYIK